jgi:hypothetical protein
MWDATLIHAKLTAMAQADPALAQFGALEHRYQLGPVLSVAQVAAFEARHRIALPEDYRSFLIEVGDGGAGPYYGLYRLDRTDLPDWAEDELAEDFLATPFRLHDRWNPYQDLTQDEYFSPRWVKGSLALAHFGCGDLVRLVVTGDRRGQVWQDGRGGDYGIWPVAPSFGDWYLDWLKSWSGNRIE